METKSIKMVKFKGTKGKWMLDVRTFKKAPKEIVLGVKTKIEDNYYQRLFDTILPKTDKEYVKEHEEIKANALLISKAPEMLEMLQSILDHKTHISREPDDVLDQMFYYIEKLIKEATEL